VVQYALRKRANVKIVDTGIKFGRDGFKAFGRSKFDDRMPLARRIFPHVHNLDGFFLCKLKVSPPSNNNKNASAAEADANADADAMLSLDNPEDQKRMEKSLKKAKSSR
jgi:ribosomal RNA methyltransferase Nop2